MAEDTFGVWETMFGPARDGTSRRVPYGFRLYAPASGGWFYWFYDIRSPNLETAPILLSAPVFAPSRAAVAPTGPAPDPASQPARIVLDFNAAVFTRQARPSLRISANG